MSNCVTLKRSGGLEGLGPLNSWEVRELKGTVLNTSIIWSTCAHINSGQFLLHCTVMEGPILPADLGTQAVTIEIPHCPCPNAAQPVPSTMVRFSTGLCVLRNK